MLTELQRADLRSVRHRLRVLYISGVGGEAVALELRLAIDEVQSVLE